MKNSNFIHHLSRRSFKSVLTIGVALLLTGAFASASSKPNIIFIMADDMGYGDVGCYNEDSKIPTPNMDRLAREGIRFTDAHSADSVCTPSRYGLMTGRYCWRTSLINSVLFNYEPPLIEKGRMTLASLLKKNGYRTAISGKWHLGLGFSAKPGKTVDFQAPLPWYAGPLPDKTVSESIDFSRRVFGGPEELGFDEAFYTAGCSTDQEPFCYIENGVFQNMSQASYRNPEGSMRSGMTAPDWDNKTVDVKFTEWALKFIDQTQSNHADHPFFLYMPLSSPHSPHVTAEFALGKSKAGVRGDMVWMVDWVVGSIDKKLKQLGLKENTLLIVTSDNGPLPGSLKPGAREGTARVSNGHLASGKLRGQKSRIWEGGHRVPFIARWPKKISAHQVSDQLLCFTDMLASFTVLVGDQIPQGMGEDSINRLPALLGHPDVSRPPMIHHTKAMTFALRYEKWKIIFGQQVEGEKRVMPTEGNGFLFDMNKDPFETQNLWDDHPEIVEKLSREFEAIYRGR